jgi:hypothetical protein
MIDYAALSLRCVYRVQLHEIMKAETGEEYNDE